MIRNIFNKKRITSIFSIFVLAGLLQGCLVTALAVGTVAATGTMVAWNDERRTLGTFIEDQAIEFKAKRKLHIEGEPGDTGNVNVTAFNNIVLITGQVASDQARTRAGHLVNSVAKVKRIYNELRVSGTSSYLTRSSDTFITSKIKSKLLTDKNVRSTKIKVITENGVVYLMGLVSQSEANVITELSRTTGGVQKVVQLFEYIA